VTSSPAAITQILGQRLALECVESCGHHANPGAETRLGMRRVLRPSRKPWSRDSPWNASNPAAITQILGQRLALECVESCSHHTNPGAETRLGMRRILRPSHKSWGRDSPWNASNPAAITQTLGQRLALECVESCGHHANPGAETRLGMRRVLRPSHKPWGRDSPWNASSPAAITQALGQRLA